MKFTLLFFLLFSFFGCATKHLSTKVEDEKKDTFKEEAFLRFSDSRLESLKKTPYKAQALCHEGQIKEGLKLLQRQTKTRKKEPMFFNEIGMCYFLSGNDAKAEYFFHLSLSKARKSHFPTALNNLGVLKLKNRHYQEALDLFTSSTKRRSKIISPLFNKAQVYLEFNLADSALPLLIELNKKGQQDPDILLSLANAYLLKGQTAQALAIIKKIPNNFGSRDDVGLARAIALYESKKYGQAKELLDEQQFGRYLPIKRSARKLQKLVNAKIEEIENAQKAIEAKKEAASKRIIASKSKNIKKVKKSVQRKKTKKD
jgi:predicted Zn-dependent protease